MIKRLPWLRRLKKTDPEPPLRLPIAAGAVSNGEGWWPDSARKRLIRKLAYEKAEEVSRREHIDRREFMASACGMATTLYMINLVNGCASSHGERSSAKAGSGSTGDASVSQAGRGGGGGIGGSSVVGGRPGLEPSFHDREAGRGGFDAGPRRAGAGGYPIPVDAMVDPDYAECLTASRGELIIDMQTHLIADVPIGPIVDTAGFKDKLPDLQRYPWLVSSGFCDDLSCYEPAAYAEQFMLGSDTTICVLSGIPYALGVDGTGSGSPYQAILSNEDTLERRDRLHQMFPDRMLSHCMVMPNDRIDVQLEMMERYASQVDNWKTYTPWSPDGQGGYFLDDDVGQKMIQKGLDLGAPIFCVHKGLPLSGLNGMYTSPRDIGPTANMFPEACLVVFHSAFEHGMQPGESTLPGDDPDADVGWGPGVGMWPEGPYDENDVALQAQYPLDRGVNSLIKSLRDNNIGPNGTRLQGSGSTTNVYAECGAVWASLMMRPIEAQHYFGKLLKHIGEDRILWGTDCLWFGSPQPLIAAFRAFEISREMQDRYGYPALTPLRKAKILGVNAARLQSAGRANIDPLSCHDDLVGSLMMRRKRELDEEWGPRRDMIARVSGPRTRREFLRLAEHEHREKLAWSTRLRRGV